MKAANQRRGQRAAADGPLQIGPGAYTSGEFLDQIWDSELIKILNESEPAAEGSGSAATSSTSSSTNPSKSTPGTSTSREQSGSSVALDVSYFSH